MPDKSSSRTDDTSIYNRAQEAAAADSGQPDLRDAVLIPLRPASPSKERGAPHARALSPLWSEVASVLARACIPAEPQPATDEPDARAA